MRLPGQLLACLFCCCLWLYGSEGQPAKPAAAPPGAQHTGSGGRSAPESGAVKLTIPDVALLDQDGNRVHFYSDLVKGRVVAVNFIFTTCTTICPPMGATFAKLQTLLGERMKKDVRLISVSVDPVTDTPERIKAWAAKFQAGPGWVLLTGPKPEVERLLRALNSWTVAPEGHSPIVLIGNDVTGSWTRAHGLAPAAKLAHLIEEAMSGSRENAGK